MSATPETKSASAPARTPANETRNDGQGHSVSDARLQSSIAVQNPSPVERLHALLGEDAVLLPLPRGEKRPAFTNWQKTTLAQTRHPEWLARLERGNIAVLVGDPSSGVCSIDIDDDEQVQPFLELNPRLASTLRSVGKRGCNLWVKITDSFPRGHALKPHDGDAWGEWRSTGNATVIHGLHPDGMNYRLEVEAPPVAIRFDEIIWPDFLKLPWVKSLSELYGEMLIREPRKKGDVVVDINETYFAGLYADENIVLHEPSERRFYRYDPISGLYDVETSDRIKSDISARMLEAAREEGIPELIPFRKDSKLNAIVATLRGITEERGAFENRPQSVHLANCFLQFHPQGFEQCGFDPWFKSRNRSPIAYDPKATCPRFLNELVIPAVHPEDVVLLQKMIGQALLGRNLVQRLVILDGQGGRGKTQLANVVQKLVGMPNVTQLRTQHLADRFEMFRFLNRTLLIGSDVEPNFLSTAGANYIKQLVGGDLIDAEQKGGTGSFQIQGNFNVFITSNARLKVKLQGDVSAWRRRLLIVRYEAPPPAKKIPDFADVLIAEEGSGILNWALQGLLMLRDDIEKTEGGDLVLTPRQKQVVDSLLAESESLRHFLESRVEVVHGRNLTVDELVEAYADHCPEMGWNPQPITEIQRELPSLMLEMFRTIKSNDIQRDGKSRKGFRNIAFKGEEVP